MLDEADARIEGSIARYRGTVSSSSSSRQRLATGRNRTHRATRSPSLDWHARSRNASEPAASVSSKTGATEIAVAREEEGAGNEMIGERTRKEGEDRVRSGESSRRRRREAREGRIVKEIKKDKDR